MPASIWELFVALFRSGEAPDDDADPAAAGDDAQFVPSPLDLSVRIAHGGSDDETVRALADIQEQADDLDHHQREN